LSHQTVLELKAFSQVHSAAVSVFARLPAAQWVAQNEHALAIRDLHPVSRGHTLVITKRVVPSWPDATPEERRALFDLVEVVRRQLDALDPPPDGYNIGINVGAAAGQTVPHLHVHVIPRYAGDVPDPRGGVRNIIPSKGNYLRDPPLATGGADDPFARQLLPLFDRATEIAVVAAFVQESGLERINPHLHGALARGAHVRILTGDYLEITQATALKMLLEWQEASRASDDGESRAGRLEARVVESQRLGRSFHPKSYRFSGPGLAVAFVGSSNLSRVALEDGVEWNLRVDRDRDPAAYERVVEAFEDLWKLGRALDAKWIDDYAARARERKFDLPGWELSPEPLAKMPAAHAVQLEALAKLKESRDAGRQRAMVVLATGLGKTALAAFDHQQFSEELGRRPRLLFLAHRVELLRQAAETYARVLRENGDHDVRAHLYVADQGALDADLVFASVAKLSRPDQLDLLAGEDFDYVVIDEAHHAEASSYRKILNVVEPKFLLGLTATPDRADAADVLGLFDDHIAYRADITRGVEIGRLVPFHYFGVKDEIDYEHIPWRNKRFDPAELSEAAQTEARMETMWRAWAEHPGGRTLIFCCSIAHALFVREWLRARGVRVAAVFSGEGSDDRDGSIQALRDGALDAVCSVDVFNEGVDVPQIDRVVMLRPTESSVIFLQQLGRGLRAHEGKSAVTVIDFVGNHRVFLERVRTLLSLAGGRVSPRDFVTGDDRHAELPAGCSVELELEAKELLARLYKVGGADEVERVYRELYEERGARPTAGELQRMGYLPSTLRTRHGSWFEFVRAMGHLTSGESAVVDALLLFLREVETTEMQRSFKMVTLEAMIEAGALTSGMSVRELAERSHAILRRSPELFDDVNPGDRVETLASEKDARAWESYWRENPVRAWTGAKRGGRAWFQVSQPVADALGTGGRRRRGGARGVEYPIADALGFSPAFAVDAEHVASLTEMVRELVDYRLGAYRMRKRMGAASAEGFLCKVSHNASQQPILMLPDRKKVAGLPEGDVDVRLSDGSVWMFSFAKIACNVARPVGTGANKLPDLLRRWFGPRAGQSGTNHQVRFFASPDGLWVEPVHAADVIPLNRIVAYPDLRAAAGHAQSAVAPGESDERIALPFEKSDPELLAVRVSGSSMDGPLSDAPMRDGDWAVLRVTSEPLHNRVMLVQIAGDADDYAYVLKRLKREDGKWLLTSDNPDGPTLAGTKDMRPIARVERIIAPERLAPPVGTVIAHEGLRDAFAIEIAPRSGRYEGHLFVFLDREGMLEESDRVRYDLERRRPGETAYVLAKREGGYRYCGVGRFSEDDGLWHIPSVDYDTWRTYGGGREVSKPLPEGAAARAQVAVDALLALPDRELVQPGGARARVVRAADRGGLRLEVSSGNERTISLTDIAWVVVADDGSGVLDEAKVNRARYLEGTPKGSTREIDTQWALAAWLRVRNALPPVDPNAPIQLVGDDGAPIDARFRVEREDGELTVIFESRGGTKASPGQRNADYAPGLELLLARLAAMGAKLNDVLLDTRETRELSREVRRLQLGTRAYPMTIDDPRVVRKMISAAQRTRGGNETRRLRLFVAYEGDPHRLAATLRFGH